MCRRLVIGDRLAQATPAVAQAIVEKFMDRFGMTELNLDFNCKPCGELYGCYFPSTNTLCLQVDPSTGTVPIYVVYHELGHALEHMYYSGSETFSYAQGEGFARYVESLYLSTNGHLLDFHCECGGDVLRILPDGSIQCVECGSVFYAPIYNPGLVSS